VRSRGDENVLPPSKFKPSEMIPAGPEDDPFESLNRVLKDLGMNVIICPLCRRRTKLPLKKKGMNHDPGCPRKHGDIGTTGRWKNIIGST
jgi:hypothetical protein